MASVISENAPCLVCEYPLYGLSPAGRCPECGTAIIESLGGRPLSTTPMEWLRRTCSGIGLIVFAYAIGPLAMLCNAYFTFTAGPGVARPPADGASLLLWSIAHSLMVLPADGVIGESYMLKRRFVMPTDMVLPVAAALLAAGCWLTTAGHAAMVAVSWRRRLARLIRGLSIVMVALPPGFAALTGMSMLIIMAQFIVANMLLLALLLYFQPVAKSIESTRLIAAFNILSVLLAIAWLAAIPILGGLVSTRLVTPEIPMAAYGAVLFGCWTALLALRSVLVRELAHRNQLVPTRRP